MALKRNRGCVATEAANKENEKISNSSTDQNNQNDWIAPDPVVKPTLFSGGGEDPLAQLELYCLSNDTLGTISNANNDSSKKIDVDELLSVAEFLFGQKPLMAALTIVDSRRSLITKLVAPSGRSVHLIRSSSAYIDTNIINNRHDGEHYLCLLSPSQSSRFVPPLRYCSCRSFLEKSTKKAAVLASTLSNSSVVPNTNDEACHDGPPVCKHLLALFLLPYLTAASASHSYEKYRYAYPEVKSITEKEFADFLLDRVL